MGLEPREGGEAGEDGRKTRQAVWAWLRFGVYPRAMDVPDT